MPTTSLHSLARFFKFLPTQSRQALWLIAFLAFGALACDILIPWFLKDILTTFAAPSVARETLKIGLFVPVIALGMIRIVFSTLHARQNALFLSHTLSELNKKMAWSCIVKKTHTFSASASELTSLYTESILTIEQFMDSVLWQTFTQGVYCFGATIIVIYLGGPLVLGAFFPFLIGIALSYLMKEKITTSINDLFSKKGEMGELCQDLLEGKEILHTYQAESRAMGLFEALEARTVPGRKRAYVLLGLYPPVFEAIGLIALIVVIIIGYTVWHKYPQSSAGAASILYLAFLAKTLISVSPLFPLWSRFQVAVEKLEQIFTAALFTTDVSTQIESKLLPALGQRLGQRLGMTSGSSSIISPGGISITKVSFGYTPQKKVFEDLSLEFAPHQVTALVGSNGSGKSTLLKLMTGELESQEGHIAFSELARSIDKIAYLPQEPFLFRMSILENLQLTSPDTQTNEIWELVEELGFVNFLKTRANGIDSPVGARGSALSGGERQKISILRFALRARNSVVCLLDEPTSYIDLQSEEALMKVVFKLCAGKTTIIVSHRPWIIDQCNHVVSLEDTKK